MKMYRDNCSVCTAARGNTTLRQRIRKATFNREEGDETLKDIALQTGLAVSAMYNHARKHIRDTSTQNQMRHETLMIRKKAIIEAEAAKELELAISPETMNEAEGRPQQIIALDEYIQQGAAEIKKGNLKMTTSGFLAAVKIRNEWEGKQASNKIDLLKTIYAFSSGKNTTVKTDSDNEEKIIEKNKEEPYGELTKADAGSAYPGPHSTSSIYRSIAGG